MTEEKIMENKLRRMAQRQGLQLLKSRRRDPRATDYGTYMLVDERRNVVASEFRNLDDIAKYLTGK